MKIVITALAIHTNTPTGGDTIFVECAKRWVEAGHDVDIITTEAGLQYCEAHGFPKDHIILWPFAWFDRFGYPISIFIKTILSTLYGVAYARIPADIYFASGFFLPDSIPAAVFRLFHPTSLFLTSFYIYTKRLFGPEYSGGRVKGFFFWFHESAAIQFIKRFHGKALMSSAYDMQSFIRLTRLPSPWFHAVEGGVDTALFATVSPQPQRYDAVFVGRFEPQKCIDALLAVWATVVGKNPHRRLALIGGGSLEHTLKKQVDALHIGNTIDFLGVCDGIKKIQILKASRLFISASQFDTGNIALDEALSCGVPGMIYDIPSMPYDKGVIRIEHGNQSAFSTEIERVLNDVDWYDKLSHSALSYARSIDWTIRAKEVLAFALSDTRDEELR